MAYVRQKGNQVAVVHGARNPETRQVEQQTLFCFYSKAEARSALKEQQHFFRRLLEDEHPDIKFNWKKIEAGIRDNLAHLPDLYSYKKERVEGQFRVALREFARELMLADPQSLMSSARLLQANRLELEFLHDLLGWRLELCEQKEHEFNKDDPFYWARMWQRKEVPPEQWEHLATLYEEHKYDQCEALARLLTECWPNFARGFNYLGLIAVEREQLETAIAHFDEAMRVGRTLFPRRIPKSMYWSNHDTRPYIRAIIHKASVLNRLQRYDEALALCDRLETECHQDITAAVERVPIYLNSGRWQPAIAAARFVHNIYPEQNFPLALGLFEDGQRHEAFVHFLTGALQFPRAARMLTGGRRRAAPQTFDEVRDHNVGVGLRLDLEHFLRTWRPVAKRFFTAILRSAAVNALIEEANEVRARWSAERGRDRSLYDRMMEMQSPEFARRQAATLGAKVGAPPVR